MTKAHKKNNFGYSREAAKTNFIVFGLIQPRLETSTYHTQGEHANHYTTDAAKPG
jgi:hypothetical protein